MRIISQDGRTDIPYENFVFGITKDNSIVAIRDIVARPSEVYRGVVAKYSTIAKAQKAMDMLREKYLETSRGCSEYAYTEFELPRVFQFPTDEEVEGQI